MWLIRIFEKDGKTYSLDNRKIKYRWASESELNGESWKFKTKDDVVSIKIRGSTQ